ncbi:sulfatase-like hydrolase/transferase [Pseudomonas chlororaphis subsp. piscium]
MMTPPVPFVRPLVEPVPARYPKRRLITALALMGICALSSMQAQAAPATRERPNIILLIADDMGWGDLASYGNPVLETPNLDRMAQQGQRWTDFYVSSPICSPSRGAMLTGRVETRTGLYGVHNNVVIENDPNTFLDEEVTVAQILKGSGYQTALFGKWHLGDVPAAYPTRSGFDIWWGTPKSNDGYFVGGVTTEALRKRALAGESRQKLYAEYLAQASANFTNPRNEMWDLPLVKSDRLEANGQVRFEDSVLERPIDQKTYNRRLTDQVVNYVGQPHERPFFVWVGYEKPHLPHFAGPEFEGTSKGGRLGDVIAELDHSVGRVLDSLRKSGNDKNTLVVFVSDNGPWLRFEELVGSAGVLREGKSSTYEGGVRVPAIFWQPGVIKPAVVHDIGSAYDLLPTFSALAGARLPAVALDGVDLSGTLEGRQPSPRTSMPYYLGGKLMAWREGDWKLNIYESSARIGGPEGKLQPPTLYNLGRDPGEKYDQAAKEPEIAQRLLEDAQAFEQSFSKAPAGFDRVLETLKKR